MNQIFKKEFWSKQPTGFPGHRITFLDPGDPNFHLKVLLPCSKFFRRHARGFRMGSCAAVSWSTLWLPCPHTFERMLPLPGRPFTIFSTGELLCSLQNPAQCSSLLGCFPWLLLTKWGSPSLYLFREFAAAMTMYYWSVEVPPLRCRPHLLSESRILLRALLKSLA